MGNSLPGKKSSVGIAAGGTITASEAVVQVRTSGQDTAVGLMAGKGTEFKNESVQAAASSADRSDAVGWRVPGPSEPAAGAGAVTPKPSIMEMMAQLKNMDPAAIGTLTAEHVVTGKSIRTAEIESGATAHAVPLIAASTRINDEEVKTISRARPSEKEQQVYADSWKTTLLDYVDEDRYNVKGEGYGLIISNVFDDSKSEEELGDQYKNCIRHGGKDDRRKIKALLKYLNIKNIDDYENVKSNELPEILEDFRTRVAENKGGLIFVVVMSHGGLERPDSVLMDDLVELDARKDMIYALGDNDALRSIPKIFLFNMCRNSWYPWEPAKTDAPTQVQSDSPSALIKHSLRDALLLFTTLPYEKSLRDLYTGAVYLTKMDEIFKASARTMTLRKMLYEVHTAVLKTHGQTPVVEDCLFKNLKFNVRN